MYRFLLACLVGLLLLAGLSDQHLCIRYPPQRLKTGNEYYTDCYQQYSPCGGDVYKQFPWKPQASPIRPGAQLEVQMSFPVTHNVPGVQTDLILSLAKETEADTEEGFKQLKTELFNGYYNQSMSVIIPKSTKPGNYILQGYFAPPGYTFFACSDVIVEEEIEPSQNQTTGKPRSKTTTTTTKEPTTHIADQPNVEPTTTTQRNSLLLSNEFPEVVNNGIQTNSHPKFEEQQSQREKSRQPGFGSPSQYQVNSYIRGRSDSFPNVHSFQQKGAFLQHGSLQPSSDQSLYIANNYRDIAFSDSRQPTYSNFLNKLFRR